MRIHASKKILVLAPNQPIPEPIHLPSFTFLRWITLRFITALLMKSGTFTRYETLAQKTILHIKKVQEWLGGVCVHGVLRCALIQNRHQLQRKSLRVQVATEGTSAGLR